MSARRRLLDDLSKMVTSAAGLLQGAGKETENALRQRFETFLDRMELVNREEFEAVKEMAARARTENEALADRLAALEGKPTKTTPKKRAVGKKKAAAEKIATKAATPKKKPGKKSGSRKKAAAKAK